MKHMIDDEDGESGKGKSTWKIEIKNGCGQRLY